MLVCLAGDILDGNSVQYEVMVSIPSSSVATVVNHVTVTSDTDDPQLNNNFTEETTFVTLPPFADLSVNVTGEPSSVITGDTILYTVSISNAGPITANDVAVDIILPPGATPVTTTGCSDSPSPFPSCLLGDIEPGGNQSYTLEVVATNPGSVVAEASVTSDTPDPNSGNNVATENVLVQAPGLVADLSISMNDASDPAQIGEIQTYSVVVENAGPAAATNTVVTNSLPSGMTFLSTTGCAEDESGGGNPLCSLGTVPPGGTAMFTINATVDSNVGTLNSLASVASDIDDPDNGNNVANESTAITPLAGENDLLYVSSSTAGTVDGISFQDEDILRYDLNTDSWQIHFDGSNVGVGGLDVDGFHVAQDGSIYLSLDNSTSLAGIGAVDDSDVVRFVPTSTGENNTAGTFSLYFDGSSLGLTTTNEDVDSVAFTPEGRLIISTSAGFNINATNGSFSGQDRDLIVIDTANNTAELYLDGSDIQFDRTNEDLTGASVDNITGEIYLTTIGNFNANGLTGDNDDVVRFSGINGPETDGLLLPFFDGDIKRIPNESIDGITYVGQPGLPSADLSIMVSASANTVAQNVVLIYSIAVSNAGPITAKQVVVTDLLPSGVTIQSTVGCVDNAGVPTCTLGDMPPGTSAQYSIEVTVNQATSGIITNTASVTSDTPDPNSGNNVATENVLVQAPGLVADLSISMNDASDPAQIGEIQTYSVVVENAGPAAATNTVVTNSLPSGMTFLSTTGCAEDESGGGNPLCSLGTVPPGGTAMFTINATVDSNVGTLNSLASVASDIDDPDNGNNVANESTAITPLAGENDLLYVSSSTAGTVDGISFQDEDILRYDLNTDSWQIHFDGSNVGVGGLDVDGFHVAQDGSIYLSLDNSTSLAGIGAVDDSDVVRFVPTSTGENNTAGTFSLYFDGSSLGLTTTNEDVDSVAFTPEGRLIISTSAGFNINATNGSFSGQDRDLIVIDTANNTAELYLDGSDIQFDRTNEDLTGASVDNITGEIYLTTIGNFNANGLTGDNDDVVRFSGINGPETDGLLLPFFDGDIKRIPNESIDGITYVGQPTTARSLVVQEPVLDYAELAALTTLDIRDSAALDLYFMQYV